MRGSKRIGRAASLLALAIGSVASAGAMAQTPAPDAPDGLQEIVVTAQKRAQSLQDVPISVTAITGDSLSAVGLDTTRSLAQTTPNLSYSGNADNVNAYIRGVGTQYATAGLEPTVAFYFDDQYIVRPTAGLLAFSDVERIEVLKGPQGTLYGRNATGGAIRIISKDPVKHFEAGGTLTYGSYDRIGASAYLNVPIADIVSARIAADFEDKDGYVRSDAPGLPRLQDRHQYTIRGKLLFDGDGPLTAKLSVDYSEKRDHEGQAFLPLPNSGPVQVGIALGAPAQTGFYRNVGSVVRGDDLDYKFHTRSGGATFRLDYDLDSAVLSSITGYRRIKFDGPADADASALVLLDVDSKQDTESVSQELQAVSKGNGPFRWTVGLYGYTELSRYKYYAWGAFAGVPDGSYIAGDGKVRTKSIAPYGEFTYAFTPRFEATVGLRYTIEEKRLRGNLITLGALDPGFVPIDGGATVIGQIPSDKVNFEEFTPKGVLTFKPNDDVMLYLSYSRGFKSGGFNLPSFGAVDKVNSEKLSAYEFGWKTEFDRVRLNGSAFYYDQKDLQVQYVNPAGAIGVQNAGSAEIYGIEADLTYAATSRLDLRAGGGWLHARFKDYVGTVYVDNFASAACAAAPGTIACFGRSAVSADLAGRELPLSAEFTAYAGIDYRVPLGASGSILFSALASYTSSYYWDAAESVREPERLLVNGSIGWRSEDEKYGLSLLATNLTDKKYRNFANKFATGGWYVPAAPREIAVQASVKF